jgi:hypothetical protein
MERCVAAMARAGSRDADIAAALDARGYRLPHGRPVSPSTVRKLRLAQGIRYRPEFRHLVQGALTLPQVAEAIGMSQQWVHHRIRNGMVRVTLDPEHKLYLFPDEPATLDAFRKLIAGEVKQIDFAGRTRD